jgi:hypothetical protein
MGDDERLVNSEWCAGGESKLESLDVEVNEQRPNALEP